MGPHRPSPLGRSLLFAALLASITTSRSLAADSPPDSTETARYTLPPTVVTPERSPLPLDKVPLEVNVIDKERLEAQKPILLAEILRQVPAIDVQRSGTLGKLTDVRLRGADPRHPLVLL